MSSENDERTSLLHSEDIDNIEDQLESLEQVYNANIEVFEAIPANISFIVTGRSLKRPQYIAAFSATFSAFAAGIVLGWTSPISTDFDKGNYYNNITVDANQMGWIGSFTTLGALLMCIPTGFLCDLIGRKRMLLSLIVPFLTGWALLIWANSVAMLYIGRIINGLAVGATCIAAPLYTSEIAQKEIRGTLGSYFQLMIVIGVFYAYFVGYFLTSTIYTICCAVIPILAFLLLLLQPESPLYLVKKQRIDCARSALQKLRGPDWNVDTELNSIESGIKDDNYSVNVLHMFQQRATVKALIISFGLMFFQQASGINAVIFYMGDIFTSSGIKLDPYRATITVGLFQVIATFTSSLVVDKLGRKKLLFISGAVMSLSMLVLAIFYTLKINSVINNDNIALYGFIPVISLCVYVVVFSLGFGPIPWMISSELFTPEVKSVAGSAAGTFNWCLAFFITKFYLNIVDYIGGDITYYIFSVFSLLGVFFVQFVVVETKGKSIGQIQADLSE